MLNTPGDPQKVAKRVTLRGGSPGSYDPSRIVTGCLDRHTGSRVAKRDSGSELQLVYNNNNFI